MEEGPGGLSSRVDVDAHMRPSSRSSSSRPSSRSSHRPRSRSKNDRPPSRSRGFTPKNKSKRRGGPSRNAGGHDPGPSLSDFDSEEDVDLPSTNGPTSVAFDWDMQAQISRLTDRNRELEDDNEEKEHQIQELAEAILTLQDEVSMSEKGPSTVGVAKELAKKNRALQMALQRQKTKALVAEGKTKALKKELMEETKRPKTPSGDTPLTPSAEIEKELKVWKDKYQQLCVRMMKCSQQARERKSQLKRALRVLAKEIGLGEDVPMGEVLEATGNWKGRAQEISLLKSKIRDLKKRMGTDGSMDRDRQRSSQGRLSPTARFDQHQREIHKISQERNQEFERLVLQHERTLTDLDALRRKNSSNKARNKVLEQESKSMREKLKVLIKKTTNDDKLIDELQQELETKKKQLAAMAKSGSQKNQSSRKERDDMASRQAQWQNSLDVQERTIDALKEDLTKALATRQSNFSTVREGWMQDEKEHEINLLQVEVDKRQELIELYMTRETETDDDLKRLAAANAKQKSRMVALEKRLDVRQKSRGNPTAKEKKARTLQQYQIELDELKAEIAGLHDVYEQQLHRKTTELSVTQKALNDVRAVQTRSLQDLHKKFEDAYNVFRK